MNKLLIVIITILIMALTLSGCKVAFEPENKTSNPSRFIMYNQDLTVFDSMIISPGYYYIVDTYTGNVYVQKTASSHVGIFPLYDENGDITKAKDMGMIY